MKLSLDVFVREFLCQVYEADRLNPITKTETFRAGIDHETTCRLEISAGVIETTIDIRRQAAFDLDRP